MSALSSVPVEVWQAILRLTVKVPRFLDPDAYEGVLSRRLFHGSDSPLNDEGSYWRAQKTRNRMQLVSKSWDSFLRQFEHRFIRMLDIRHGKVPPQKLQLAMRVSFRDYNCECTEFCVNSSLTDYIVEALAQVGSLGAEIVDMPEMPLIIQRSFKLENIKVLVSARFLYKYWLSGSQHALPSLQHCSGVSYYGTSDIEWGKSPLASNLITLTFSIWPEQEYDPIILDFPCLRHLRINSDARTATVEFTKGAALNILRVVGSQLRSFYLHHVPSGNETFEVWDLCPNMETFHTSFLLVSPPLGHPIHTLHLHLVEQMEGLYPLDQWPNLRKVVLEYNCNEIDFRGSDPFVVSRDNLRAEDQEGVTLVPVDEYYRQF